MGSKGLFLMLLGLSLKSLVEVNQAIISLVANLRWLNFVGVMNLLVLVDDQILVVFINNDHVAI